MKTTLFEKARNHFTSIRTVIDYLNKDKKVSQTSIAVAKKDMEALLKILDSLESKYGSSPYESTKF